MGNSGDVPLKQIYKGLTTRKNNNGWTVAFLHYTADPTKTLDWAKEERRRYSSNDVWNQEMEIDFTKTSGLRVFMEFDNDVHVEDLQAVPGRIIYRGWDFGYGHPAVVWCQLDPDTGTFYLLKEYMGTAITLYDFLVDVKNLSERWFPGYTFKDFGDPSVRKKNELSARTSAEILRQNGICSCSSRTAVHTIHTATPGEKVDIGLNAMNALMHWEQPVDENEKPATRFKVDSSCKLFIDAALGGYARNEDDKPIKDSYYDHLVDATRYVVTGLFNMKTLKATTTSRLVVLNRPTASTATGY